MSDQEPRRSDGDPSRIISDKEFRDYCKTHGLNMLLEDEARPPDVTTRDETDTPTNDLESELNDCVKNFIDIAQDAYNNPTRQNIETYQLHHSTIVQELKKYVRAMRNSIPDDDYEGIVEMVSDVSLKICEINDSVCQTFSRITGKDYVLSCDGDREDNQDMIMAAEENTDLMVNKTVAVFRMMLDDDMQSFQEILEQRHSTSPRARRSRLLRSVGHHTLDVAKVTIDVVTGYLIVKKFK